MDDRNLIECTHVSTYVLGKHGGSVWARSYMMIVSAACRFNPTPPARMLSKNTLAVLPGSLKFWTCMRTRNISTLVLKCNFSAEANIDEGDSPVHPCQQTQLHHPDAGGQCPAT